MGQANAVSQTSIEQFLSSSVSYEIVPAGHAGSGVRVSRSNGFRPRAFSSPARSGEASTAL